MKGNLCFGLAMFLLLAESAPLRAATIRVPQDMGTIQAAIDTALPGDTVLAESGVYQERIDFKGKTLTVKSVAGPTSTIINGGGEGPVVSFHSEEGPSTLLEGFTLTNGREGAGGAAGIECRNNSSPTLTNCVVRDNQGTGIGCYNASLQINNSKILNNAVSCQGAAATARALFTGCTLRESPFFADKLSLVVLEGCVFEQSPFSATACNTAVINNSSFRDSPGYGIECNGLKACSINNSRVTNNLGGIKSLASFLLLNNILLRGNAAAGGGGLDCRNSTLEMVNCLIDGNRSTTEGAAIYSGNSQLILLNSTVVNNSAPAACGGIAGADSALMAANSIFWANSNKQFCFNNSSLEVEYSLVQGGDPSAPGQPYPGTGNIDGDPLFLDTAAGEYRLKYGSSCIDNAMDSIFRYPSLPYEDLAGGMRPLGENFDMGAYEYDCRTTDSDGDGLVDCRDNCILDKNADQRDTNNDNYGNRCDCDLDNNNKINVFDLSLFRNAYMNCRDFGDCAPDADFNGDGKINSLDLGFFKNLYYRGSVGPSGLLLSQ